MQPLRLHCPAKLNLALSVGAPDAATGLHPIASWMVALTFGDDIAVGHSADDESHFDIHFEDDQQQVDWPLEKDLVFRAHGLIEQHAGRKMPIHVQLNKRIPTGAGLGGGSSDAAAMLVAMDQLCGLQLSRDELIGMAMELGSDVGFLVGAIGGEYAAMVSGFGECIEAIPLQQIIDLTLIFPGFESPTGQVYGEFDRLLSADSDGLNEKRVCSLIEDHDLSGESLFNDLAAPACSVLSELGDIQSGLTQSLGRPVHVTGSGSTLFVIAAGEQDAGAMARSIHDEYGLDAIATQVMR
jgi:4-diphosphocytidyl-2-C-methyl-D-erythritol kinase